MKKFLSFVGVLGVMVLGWANLGFCGTVTVYSPAGTVTGTYTTIQAGVGACLVGGTVSASAGIYTGTVSINKGIALIGVGTPTIDPPSGDAVTFTGTPTNGAVISGFIITGAPSGYSGIYCNNGSPTITNNTITGNNNGISCASSSPSITNNTISGNIFCGIHCYESSSPSITNNTISGNSWIGIYCCDSSSSSIVNNILTENTSGISCNSSSPFITNNTISGNSFYGIHCSYSSPTIFNNIITENGTTSTSYYGIYNDSSGNPIINYNCVWWNGSPPTNNYSGCSGGLGSITANPQFIGGGDFHLKPSSPCIDKGSNTAPGIPSTDKDGKPKDNPHR